MKTLGVIAAMLMLSPHQAPTIERYDASYKSEIVSVVRVDRGLNLTADAATALTGSQANTGADANARLAISTWDDLNAIRVPLIDN